MIEDDDIESDEQAEINQTKEILALISQTIQISCPGYEFGVLLFKPIQDGAVHFMTSVDPLAVWQLMRSTIEKNLVNPKETKQ